MTVIVKIWAAANKGNCKIKDIATQNRVEQLQSIKAAVKKKPTSK